MRHPLATAACLAAALIGGCESDPRGPVAGPELWRARPAAGRTVHQLVATGDGDVIAHTATTRDGRGWLERVGATGSVWSVPIATRPFSGSGPLRLPLAAAADGGAIIVTMREDSSSGEPAVDHRVQRLGPDGTMMWDRLLAHATTTNTSVDALVVGPEGIYVILRVDLDARLEFAGTVLRGEVGENENCRWPSEYPCWLMALARLDDDGDLLWVGRVTLNDFSTDRVVLVPGYLVIGGDHRGVNGTDIIAAIRLPPGTGPTISPLWSVEDSSVADIRLVTGDAAGQIYGSCVPWSSARSSLLRVGPDGVANLSEPIGDYLFSAVPAAGGVTANVNEDALGLGYRRFLVTVDASGDVVGREVVDGGYPLVEDADGRLFYGEGGYLEGDEIVARDALP